MFIVTSRFVIKATACLHNFRRSVGATLKFWSQKSDMKQVPCWWSTNNRRYRTKFSCHDDLAPGICAPLSYFKVWHMYLFGWSMLMIIQRHNPICRGSNSLCLHVGKIVLHLFGLMWTTPCENYEVADALAEHFTLSVNITPYPAVFPSRSPPPAFFSSAPVFDSGMISVYDILICNPDYFLPIFKYVFNPILSQQQVSGLVKGSCNFAYF